MKTGNHHDRIGLHAEKQRIWKLAHLGTPDVAVHHRKLPGVVGEALHYGSNLGAEAAAEAGRFAFIPVLRADQLRSRCRSENDRQHLWATLFEFSLKSSPGYPLSTIVIERRKAMVELRLLRFGQRQLVILQAVPKLCNQRKPLLW